MHLVLSGPNPCGREFLRRTPTIPATFACNTTRVQSLELNCLGPVSSRKVVVDSCTRLCKRVLLRQAQDVIRLRVQKVRAREYVDSPFGRVLNRG